MVILPPFICVLVALISLSCNESTIDTPYDKNQPPSIRFYYRVRGCNNDDCTYGDYLVLENYSNKSFRLNQLIDLARSYVDTAKADLPVSGVVFVGEERGKRLPYGSYSEYSGHKHHQVVSIAFENKKSDEKSRTQSNRVAIYIGIWKDGESTGYSLSSADSLLKANPLLDNEN